jgi:membrane protease subunit HflK
MDENYNENNGTPFKSPFGPEDIINAGKKKLPDLSKYIPLIVGGVLIVIFLLSSFYSVGPDEVGVIRRFGRYVRTTMPGLHVKFPMGIETVDKVKVKYIFKEEFGFRTVKAGIKTRYSPREYYDESLMLTGDLNVIVVEWIVQFRVKDPTKLLFNIRDPRATIRSISEAVMRLVVGDYSVSEVLTTQRVEINNTVQEKLQEILDSYDSGIQIVTIKLQDVNPPDPVKPSFNEVNEAKQEREKMINQAWEQYNKAIPAARGQAEKTIREAEGYALNRVNQAKGDAAKFIATWNAYKNAKDVTRKRLYLETMNDIIPKAGKKYIIDPDQRSLLPLLRLEDGAK